MRCLLLAARFASFHTTLASTQVCAQCQWVPSDGYRGFDAPTRSLVVWKDPRLGGREVLAIAGDFALAGETPASHVVTWDGSMFRGLGAGVVSPSGGDNYMSIGTGSLAVFRGDLYLCANYREFPSAPPSVSGIWRWTGDDWVEIVPRIAGLVNTITVYQDELITAGLFSTIGGVSAGSIAAWNGVQWRPLGSGVNNTVYALAARGPELFAGGLFSSAGGLPSSMIARWDGAAWRSLGTGVLPSPGGFVSAIQPTPEGVIVGGAFTTAGGVQVSNVAKWSGSGWAPMGTLPNVYGFVFHQRDLLACSQTLMRWTGTEWVPFDGAVGSYPSSAATYQDSLVVAGQIGVAGSTLVSNAASFRDGQWQPLYSLGFIGRWSDSVTFLTTYRNQVIVFGAFTGIGGGTVSNKAYWDGRWRAFPDPYFTAKCSIPFGDSLAMGGGTVRLWDGEQLSFPAPMPPTHLGASVNALAVYNGRLVAAGRIGVVTTQESRAVYQLDAAGWTLMGEGLAGLPQALEVYDGRLIAGGSIFATGSTPLRSLAEWDGQHWSEFAGGTDGVVSSMASFGGELIIAGGFQEAGGVPVQNLARWNGVVWRPMPLPFSGGVTGLRVVDDRLLAWSNADVSGAHLAAWDGQVWAAVGGQIDGGVNTLAPRAGDLWIGGKFRSLNGVASPLVARRTCRYCYANCDGSEETPLLDVNDLQCFLRLFAAGSPRANCDGSAIYPELNVLDFACFVNHFSRGCP